MSSEGGTILVASARYKQVLKKLRKKDTALVREIDRAIGKILQYPEFGKPLKHSMRNYRRTHVEGSYVLLYEIRGSIIGLIDLDHHDRIYKKYS